jgi:hypothetical protein
MNRYWIQKKEQIVIHSLNIELGQIKKIKTENFIHTAIQCFT